MFLQPKKIERKDKKVLPAPPVADQDTRLKELDELNTNLAAALLVGLAKARNENEELRRLMEHQKAECDVLDAVEANRKLRELVDKYFNLNAKLLQRADEQKRKISALEAEKNLLKSHLEHVQHQLQYSQLALSESNAKYESECKRNSSLTKHAGDLEAKLQQQQELQVQQEELKQQSFRQQDKGQSATPPPCSSPGFGPCDYFSLDQGKSEAMTLHTIKQLLATTCFDSCPQSLFRGGLFWLVLCLSVIVVNVFMGKALCP